MNNLISRMTSDIDSLYISKDIKSIYSKYGLNTRVVSYSDCFAASYRDRMEIIEIKTKVMKYYKISLEDIVISKLGALRPQDREDIYNKALIKSINLNILKNIYEEVYLDSLSERTRSELKYAYDEYIMKNK